MFLFKNFSFTLRCEIYSIGKKGLSYLVNSVKECAYQLFTKLYTEGCKSRIIIGGYNFEKEGQNVKEIFIVILLNPDVTPSSDVLVKIIIDIKFLYCLLPSS